MSVAITFDYMYEAYLEYRRKSGLKKSTIFGLVQFHRDCKKNFPDKNMLTKEMVDVWVAKRDTETASSNRSRIAPIIGFLKYALVRGWLNFDIPQQLPVKQERSIPHAFTDEELRNFFKACDEIEDMPYTNAKLKRIEVPVFFRLLYSSGMRTTEGRLLRCEDINLNTGVVTIRHTKGYNEHVIVLHNTMREVLVEYDKVVGQLLPNRQYFFPACQDKCHWNLWVSDCFREMWLKYNSAKAVPYHLRHNYAIENINKWTNAGYEVHDNLVALSKSMGHSLLANTLYYYSLVPKLHKTIEELSGAKFNQIIPDLPDEED